MDNKNNKRSPRFDNRKSIAVLLSIVVQQMPDTVNIFHPMLLYHLKDLEGYSRFHQPEKHYQTINTFIFIERKLP